MGEAVHLTVVNVFGKWQASGHPGLRESVTEVLQLRDVGMRDGDRATGADLLELRRVTLGVLGVTVVRRTLAKIWNQRLPGPFRATAFRPPIKGRLAAGDPAEVVASGAAAEDLAAGVGPVNARPVVRFTNVDL
jgi:hypothetical protein